MSKLGGFFARKSGLYDKQEEPATVTTIRGVTALPDNPLEIDEELFNALSTQMGGENEQLRNLMLDASAKIGELDAIKAAVDKLVDPVSKTLRAIEAEKAEKMSLQTVLNTTRTAYGKLRNEVGEIEKKATAADKECQTLRLELASTQAMLRTAEATKAEIATDVAARRAQIAELESRLTHEAGETRILREENKRLDDRLSASEKRVISIESDLNANRQRLMMAEDEKQAQQAAFEKASADVAKLARKLTETEANLTAAQGRLRHVEANFAELNAERTRLTGAFDEAKERHEHELSTQRMRFDTLQARASATEKLLIEAREHLIARAEEIRDFDRRNVDMARERDALASRVADLEADRYSREAQHQEVEQSRATLMERSATLARAFTGKESALARAEETIGALNTRIGDLEVTLTGEKQTNEQTVEELKAALRREQMQRAVVEGALEAGRKEYSRLMREVMVLQRNQQAAEEFEPIKAANAA